MCEPLPVSSLVLNKFKRRKFLKTKNLLTGETEADPEMIKVSHILIQVDFFLPSYIINFA